MQQRFNQDFIGEEDGYSTDLDECKSQASSQSPKSRKSQNNFQIEAPTGETLVLSDELETVQIVDKEEPEQAVTVSQFIVVDSQSDGELEDVGKNSDVNEEYIQKYFVKQLGVLFTKKRALQDLLEFWGIAKKKLSNFLRWFNFRGRQDAQTTRINYILFYLFYFQVLWQIWADTGG